MCFRLINFYSLWVNFKKCQKWSQVKAINPVWARTTKWEIYPNFSSPFSPLTLPGRKTFPSRGKRPPLSSMHDDAASISDSMSSLGRSSSSGISPDYEDSHQRRRTDSDGSLSSQSSQSGQYHHSFNPVDNTRCKCNVCKCGKDSNIRDAVTSVAGRISDFICLIPWTTRDVSTETGLCLLGLHSVFTTTHFVYYLMTLTVISPTPHTIPSPKPNPNPNNHKPPNL